MGVRDKEVTRRRLLDIGRQRLVEGGLPDTLNLKLSTVLEDAGLTTGAAYNIWSNQADYLRELTLHLARNVDWADGSLLEATLSKLPTDLSPEHFVNTIAGRYFRHFVDREEFYLTLYFYGIRQPSRDLAETVIHSHDSFDRAWISFHNSWFEAADLEPVPPHSIGDLCLMVSAAVEGFALRCRFQSEEHCKETERLFVAMCHNIYATTVREKPAS